MNINEYKKVDEILKYINNQFPPQLTTGLGYDDICIVPEITSELSSRKLASTSTEICGVKFGVPIMSAPMPDVTNSYLAKELQNCGGLPVLHRFQSIGEQIIEFQQANWQNEYFNKSPAVICALPVKDWEERFNRLVEVGCEVFLLDTANGNNTLLAPVISSLLKENVKVIAGNIASAQGFKYLADLGVNAVRVGVGGGKGCTTKNKTGIFQPYASLLVSTVNYKEKYGLKTEIIADGGIRGPDDLCKALAIGANAVMVGSMLASCKESPAKTAKFEDKIYKIYRGAASFSVKQDYGQNMENIEGKETLLNYSGTVADLMKDMHESLQSSMSYLNARNLTEYKENARFMELK